MRVGEAVLVVAEEGLKVGIQVGEVSGLVVVVEIELLQEFCRVKGLGILAAEEGDEAGVDLAVVDVVEVLGDAVEKVVGDNH